jgi:hypothetical protein
MEPPIPFQMFGKSLGKFRISILWNSGNSVIGKVMFLELLAHIFGIPTPKDDIDGSMVADILQRRRYRQNHSLL